MANKTFSIYDEKYFTPEEKKYLSDVKRRAEAGQTDWGSAHSEFEKTRASHGYSGGNDGSQYIRLGNDTSGSFGTMETPTYQSPYQKEIDQLKNALLAQREFNYDVETDPAYKELEKVYTKNAQRAMDDTLGKVSARTGGIASSYAGQVAQSTHDNYMDGLTEKALALREAAYEKSLAEKEQLRSDFNTLLALEQNAKNDYYNDIALDRAAKQFNYGVYRDEKNDKTSEIAQAWNEAKEKALLGDYSGYKALGVDTTRYQSDLEYQKKVDDAFKRWSVGDPSGLIDLGYNLDNFYADKEKAEQDAAKAQALEEAATGASLGDFRGYRNLGYDTSRAEAAYIADALGSAEKKTSLSTAKDLAKDGIFSDDVIQTFLSNGYTYADLYDIYGYSTYTPEEIKSYLTDVGAVDNTGTMSLEAWNSFLAENPFVTPQVLRQTGIYVDGMSPTLQDYLKRYSSEDGEVPSNIWDKIVSQSMQTPGYDSKIVSQSMQALGYYRGK